MDIKNNTIQLTKEGGKRSISCSIYISNFLKFFPNGHVFDFLRSCLSALSLGDYLMNGVSLRESRRKSVFSGGVSVSVMMNLMPICLFIFI